MHLKTLLKGYIAQLVESIRDGVAGEIYDYIKQNYLVVGGIKWNLVFLDLK